MLLYLNSEVCCNPTVYLYHSPHPAIEHRGRAAIAVLLRAAGSHGRAQHNVGQLWAEQGHVHGGVAVLVLHVDVGALVHQQLHQLRVTLRHSQLQRRLVAVVADVDVTSPLQEEEERLLRGSPAGGGPPPTTAHLLDEDFSHVSVVVQSSQMERREPVVLFDIHQLSRSGQDLLCGPADEQTCQCSKLSSTLMVPI